MANTISASTSAEPVKQAQATALPAGTAEPTVESTSNPSTSPQFPTHWADGRATDFTKLQGAAVAPTATAPAELQGIISEITQLFTANKSAIEQAIHRHRNLPADLSHERVLLGQHCGSASKALHWILKREGIQTQGLRDNPYTPTHEFLLWRHGTQQLLIDATYRQFFAEFARSVAINRAGAALVATEPGVPPSTELLAKRYEAGRKVFESDAGALERAADAVLAEFPLPEILVLPPEQLQETLVALHQRLGERYGDLLMPADSESFNPSAWRERFQRESGDTIRWARLDFKDPALNVTSSYDEPGVQRYLDP